MPFPKRKQRYFEIITREDDDEEEDDEPLLAAGGGAEPEDCTWLIILIIVLVVIGTGIGIFFALQPGEENDGSTKPPCTYEAYEPCLITGIQYRQPVADAPAHCAQDSRECRPDNPYTNTGLTKDLNLIIPAYFYPTNNGVLVADWLTLNTSVHTYKDIRHVIVLNPNNGLDATSPPNSDWIQVVNMFGDVDNVVLIGYVSTNYGDATKEAPGKDQITGYISQWKCQGIFFDETTGDKAMYERLVAHTRTRMKDTWNVFNFGSKADANGNEYDNAWLSIAELNIMFENKFDQVATFTPSAAQLALDRTKSAVVLLEADPNMIDLQSMYDKHFGYVYFVDRPNDYNGLMSNADWNSFMQDLDGFQPPGGIGSVCTANGDCASNDCRAKCCVATLNDANCGVCSDTGFCESCAAGFTWQAGQGCVAVSGDPAGTVCTQNSDCTDNDCRGKCCVSTLNDANCATCGAAGFCEACATGYSWQAGQGCTLDIQYDGNTYTLCSPDTANVIWNGNHNIQEVSLTGHIFYSSSTHIGSAIHGFESNGHQEIISGLGATAGQRRYFLCTTHPSKKFITECPAA